MITYEKMIAIFEERGITSYTVKRDKVLGQASWKKIHEGGDIDTRTLDNLCRYLKCQPGDLLSFTDEAEPGQDSTVTGEA